MAILTVDSVDSSIRRGPNSRVFRKFFQLERFRSGFFCIELEKYRPFQLESIIFRSKKTELRKKSGGTYKREIFLLKKKYVLVNNFGTTRKIQLILKPLDQKLAELTNKNINYSKKKA